MKVFSFVTLLTHWFQFMALENMDGLIEIGDFIVFEKGKYIGQQGIVEATTKKMFKIRIAPHCKDSLKLVTVRPTSLRKMVMDELRTVRYWDWKKHRLKIKLY